MSQALMISPRSFAIRELVEVAWNIRRWSIVWATLISLLAIIAAILITPKSVSDATLLLMLGPEYTVRGNADDPSLTTAAMDADHITGSESAILGSDDLHRQVIREIGLENVYPDYVHPGAVAVFIKNAKLAVTSLFSSNTGDQNIDPIDYALVEFSSHLTVVASRQGNVINLSFGHDDPAMAQKVLTVLVKDYLDFRRTMYSNEQSDVLKRQLVEARGRLDVATKQLADYSLQMRVGSYETRMDILLHEQGDAENDANEAESQVVQQSARVATLTAALADMTPTVAGGNDHDVDQRLIALRITLDALRARRAEALALYWPTSPQVRFLEEQIQQREAELSSGRSDRSVSATHSLLNTVYQGVQTDLTRASADLKAAQARQLKDHEQRTSLVSQISDMQQGHRQLDELERQQAVADEIYRGTAKLLDARQTTEEIDARKTPSVRVAQAPDFPLKTKPTRMIILALGIIMSGAGAVGFPLLANFFRRTYILPQGLEQDVGLPVLVVIPRLPRNAPAGWASLQGG